MGRKKGSRNADYEVARDRLAELLRHALAQRKDGASISFRELATLSEVSTATLRHYFGDRDGVLGAVLQSMHRAGAPHLAAAAALPIAGVRASLSWLLHNLVQGWRLGVGGLHQLGLTAGLGNAVLGPSYVNELLEPTLQAVEARIARHVAQGELGPLDVRHAALELLSPLLLGLLHQVELGGSGCRPLDLPRFLEDHLDRFLRAHAPPPKHRRSTPRAVARFK